jgi:hypothetical protein
MQAAAHLLVAVCVAVEEAALDVFQEGKWDAPSSSLHSKNNSTAQCYMC